MRGGLFGEADELGLTLRALENGVIEPRMSKLIGDLKDEIGKSVLIDPPADVPHSGTDGVLIPQPFVLSLVEAPENDDHAAPVARLDHTPDAPEIRVA